MFPYLCPTSCFLITSCHTNPVLSMDLTKRQFTQDVTSTTLKSMRVTLYITATPYTRTLTLHAVV